MLFLDFSDRCASVPKQTASAMAARLSGSLREHDVIPCHAFMDYKRRNPLAIHLNCHCSCGIFRVDCNIFRIKTNPPNVLNDLSAGRIIPHGTHDVALGAKGHGVVRKIRRSPSDLFTARKKIPQNFTDPENDAFFQSLFSIIAFNYRFANLLCNQASPISFQSMFILSPALDSGSDSSLITPIVPR